MDEATARPWRTSGPGEYGEWWIVAKDGRFIAANDGGPSAAGDLGLAVEAVNAYDRLRAIEAAARAYVAWQYRVPGASRVTLSDLRDALDPREREEPRP